MKYAIFIAPSAERDIRDAADYIEHVLLNPEAASGLLDALEAAAVSLRENPLRREPAIDPVLRAWGIRFMRIGNYLAFFTVDEEKRRVNIVRFLYARRNWIGILKDCLPLE